MYTTPNQRRTSIYLHWEKWVGLILLGACAVFGGYLGGRLGHHHVGLLVGALVGGSIDRAITLYVARRYYPLP